ncbi:MAG: hypothetical protein WDN08_18920 [Rhizomicrobium sp.]
MHVVIAASAFLLASVSAVLAEEPAPPPAAETAPAAESAPAAVPEAMAATIGNTVKVVDAKGLESHTYFAADGTFSGIAPAYDYHYQGKWEIAADGQLCRIFDPVPPGVVNPLCSKLEAHAVGDSWTDPDGASGALLAGQQ